jgi:hypothetical protein
VAILNPVTLAGYAKGAGWGGQDAVVAVAVALAESGGNTQAHATRGEDSRGLWQINVAAHPQFANVNLYDPATNAKIAHDMWAAQGWGPWSAHNSGAYLLFMPAAGAAVVAATPILGGVAGDLADAAQPGYDAALGAAGTVFDTGRVIGGFLADLESPQIWSRVLKVLIGGALIYGGLVLFAKPVIEPVLNQATKVGKAVI